MGPRPWKHAKAEPFWAECTDGPELWDEQDLGKYLIRWELERNRPQVTEKEYGVTGDAIVLDAPWEVTEANRRRRIHICWHTLSL